ncbi:MAG: hypothetical protein KJ747_04480 [Actinobacteria bacterium]|nr:hypothetical protein [Actinomycetota bacterium]MCG2807974.1 hypothetical protein [Coriobacteriia bacterium]MDP2233555.1 hypothetical protein [Actinomycetota bacterium]
MGQLYQAVSAVEQVISRKGLDDFKTKGLISMKAGFFLSIVNSTTPDDTQKIGSLRSAAEEVLGEKMPF